MDIRMVQIAKIKRSEVLKLMSFQRDVLNIVNDTQKNDEQRVEDVRNCLNSWLIDNIKAISTGVYNVELLD